MMFKQLTRLLAGTLRRQLVLGMVLVVGSMMSLFVWDLTRQQQAQAQDRQSEQAVAIAHSVAVSGAVWVLARDFAGLQEIVQGLSPYPDLRYAMVLDSQGQVLAHSDPARLGSYLTDLPPTAALKVLQLDTGLVDVAAPVLMNGRPIGWACIGLAGNSLQARLVEIRHNGYIYTVLALVLTLVFAFLASRYLTRRLDAIAQVAKAVQAGDTSLRARMTGEDEAAQLARQFNDMLDTLAQRDRALKDSEDTFRTLFETAPHGVIYHELSGRITSANPAAQRILGLTQAQLQGRTPLDPLWCGIHEDGSDFPWTQHPISVALKTGQPVKEVQMGVQVPGRGRVWLLVSATPLLKDGQVTQAYAIVEDITDRYQMQQQVRQLAFYDPLTQLPNRRLLIDRLNHALTFSKRSACFGALMFLDLDNFKPLNDRHGHDMGDLLLQEVAQRLKHCVREVDTAARFGGDEFVGMLVDLDADQAQAHTQAHSVAEKIRASLAQPYVLTYSPPGRAAIRVEHHCTASIGVVLFIHDEGTPDDFLQRSDAAMYQAKASGRNAVQFYSAQQER